jgi:predicted Zn-dependent peptidase
MRSPAVTEENLANQISVVKEEIRVNVLNQPYGGFPWLSVPPVLFETFPNAHNGYGGFEDLESATVDDARDFFDRYYAPGNAVLVVGGDLDPAETMTLVERHFGDVPARAVPRRPDFDEPPPTTEKRGEQVDPQAPAPALALSWRTPDPADLTGYLPYVVLSSSLTTGDASRLRRRLMHEESLATDVGTHIGVMQDAFDVRNPTIFTIEAHHSADVAADRVVAAADEELDKVATDGVDRSELERVQARLESAILQGSDHVLARTLSMAVFEQQRGRAELVGELAGLVAEVTPEQVQAAAATLRPDARARVDLVAGAK